LRLQLFGATAAEWDSHNPVLLKNEIGIDTTNNMIKIGDGIKHWNSLDYVSGPAAATSYANQLMLMGA